MANLLYITAHPFDDTQSYSMAVGKEFIKSYKKLNLMMKSFILIYIRLIFHIWMLMSLTDGINLDPGPH